MTTTTHAIAEVCFGRISEGRGDEVDIVITEFADGDNSGTTRVKTISLADWEALPGGSYAAKLESYTCWDDCEHCDATTIASSEIA